MYHNNFMCTCSKRGEEECLIILSEVMKELKCDSSNFVSNVIMALHWDYGTTIDFIGCDMWFGVGAIKRDKDFKDIEQISFFCDEAEHGLAAIYKYISEKYESLS